jgi:Tfp pilus assembly protein PilN
MIEINLLEKKKGFKAPVVLGIDIAKLPWKSIIISCLVVTYPMDFLREQLVAIQTEKSGEVVALRNNLSKLKRELRGNRTIKDQLQAFNKQIERLKSRTAQVDKIIKLKTNPRYLLEHLARSAPEDLWFDELILNDKNGIIIKGASESYKSIGLFIAKANDSAFFGKSLQLKDSKTKEVTERGVTLRQENFTIEGNISVFDPFIGSK